MFWNKGKWIDVECHVHPINIKVLDYILDTVPGVVVFQYNDKTKKRRAVIKTQTTHDKIVDADVAQAMMNVQIQWP